MENYSEVKGRIFNIQKFSIHDGPGIRTIVFFKGCKLRCKWCCNPESQDARIQEMNEGGKIKIVGRDITVDEVVKDVLKDMPYYRRSGGGITLSGGEFLCQPKFAKALLATCKEYGISTAVESTAYAPYDTIKEILPYIDVCLIDIKHMNSQIHKEFTGVENTLILENIAKLGKEANELIIRTPVIPTVNANEKDIEDIAKYAKQVGAKEYHLLPYHRLGQDKYEGLGRDYLLKELVPPTDEFMDGLLKVAQRHIKAQIGG